VRRRPAAQAAQPGILQPGQVGATSGWRCEHIFVPTRIGKRCAASSTTVIQPDDCPVRGLAQASTGMKVSPGWRCTTIPAAGETPDASSAWRTARQQAARSPRVQLTQAGGSFQGIFLPADGYAPIFIEYGSLQ
jgi:hypothetical protein